jgi:hypothetical protein
MSDQDEELKNCCGKRNLRLRSATTVKRQKISRVGRPPLRPKYVFTNQDLELVEQSLLHIFPPTGVDYLKIQNDLFKLRNPPVSLKDVQNLVNNSPHLKNRVKEAHARLKAGAKRKFDETINSKRSSEPQVIIPKKETFLDHVFYLESSDHYGFVYRHNLAQIVEVTFDESRTEFIFNIESRELEEEQHLLGLAELLDGRDFEKVYNYSKDTKIISFNIPIPPNAIVEKVERKDIDTWYGCLVEISLPKKKQLDLLKLKPKRHAHIKNYACSSQQLISRSVDRQWRDILCGSKLTDIY